MAIERRSSGQQVADHLRRRIFTGAFPPGTRLRQAELANELGVSRIPIREALVILESEGRVRMEHHKGAFVLPMGEESVRDNSHVYGMVHAFIARRATERATPEMLSILAQLEERLVSSADARDIREINDRYLDVITDVGAGPRIIPVLRALRSLAVDNLDEVIPAAAENMRKGLVSLIRSVRAGDADAVEAETMRLAHANSALVVEEFRRRGVLGESQ